MRRIGTCRVMLVSFAIVISTAILCVSVDADGHQEHLMVIEPSEGISTDDPIGFILEFEAISAELDRYPDHAFVLCVPPLYGDDLYDIVVEAIGQEHFISESSLEESDLGPWINVTVSGPPGPDGRSIDLGFLEEVLTSIEALEQWDGVDEDLRSILDSQREFVSKLVIAMFLQESKSTDAFVDRKGSQDEDSPTSFHFEDDDVESDYVPAFVYAFLDPATGNIVPAIHEGDNPDTVQDVARGTVSRAE